jgi:hypothetical protein
VNTHLYEVDLQSAGNPPNDESLTIGDLYAAPPLLPLWPELGRVLGLSEGSTYALAARGDLPMDLVRVGRRRYARTADVLAWLHLNVSDSATANTSRSGPDPIGPRSGAVTGFDFASDGIRQDSIGDLVHYTPEEAVAEFRLPIEARTLREWAYARRAQHSGMGGRITFTALDIRALNEQHTVRRTVNHRAQR